MNISPSDFSSGFSLPRLLWPGCSRISPSRSAFLRPLSSSAPSPSSRSGDLGGGVAVEQGDLGHVELGAGLSEDLMQLLAPLFELASQFLQLLVHLYLSGLGPR